MRYRVCFRYYYRALVTPVEHTGPMSYPHAQQIIAMLRRCEAGTGVCGDYWLEPV